MLFRKAQPVSIASAQIDYYDDAHDSRSFRVMFQLEIVFVDMYLVNKNKKTMRKTFFSTKTRHIHPHKHIKDFQN